jgi:hypothetical protein
MTSKNLQFLLTFIIAVVPFVIIIYFGLAVINYDAIAGLSGWPLVLPLDSLLSPLIVGALAFYIGQTMWLWWDWSKLRKPRRGAADSGEYRQPEFLEWCLTRLDGAGPDTPWYCGLGPHELLLFPLTAAKLC